MAHLGTWLRAGRTRALGTSVTTAGGYTVPQSFYDRIVDAQLLYGGMKQVSKIPKTTDGHILPVPTDNDTASIGALVAENTALAEQDVPFGQVSLNAYMYTSKIVRVSYQLLQHSVVDIESFLGDLLGLRIRIINSHLTVGTGSGQPNGVVTVSASGKVGATDQTLTVTYDDLVDLVHSVDPLYRGPNARFMLHDSSLKVIQKLKDTQNRPLWVGGLGEPSLAAPNPPTILGYPYTINPDMPVMAANTKSILFGDFSNT